MPSLFVIQGRDQGHRFTLDEPSVGVGRVSENGIRLHDTEVSRKHAVLETIGDGYQLRDLNSSNGTYVNGKPVRERRLMSGDQITVGRTTLLYTGATESIADIGDDVSIVDSADRDGSRILHAISQTEGSDLLAVPADQTQSPWLAKAKANLQLMYRTSLAVSRTLDIDELLARIMGMIFEWVDADRGCIMLKDDRTGKLRPRVRRGRPGDAEVGAEPGVEGADAEPVKIAISQTILDYVVERREGVLTSNAGDDKRWDPAGSIMQMGVREAICVPMEGRYDLVGVIYIDTSITPKQMLERRSANKFGQDHLKLMVAIAHQAALAVEDTTHYSAMVQAERLAAVGQTIATLSHHIKNILQGVSGGKYLIEQGLDTQEESLQGSGGADAARALNAVGSIRKGWGIVEKNQDRISRLVLDMLTFSKERKPEPEPTDLNEVVADVVELSATRAKDAGVELRWVPADGPITLNVDPEAIHRAVLNLVGNAVDACEGRDSAWVEVATTLDATKGVAAVSVSDSGSGIAAEDIEAIFEPFHSSKGSAGTGLGLAVTRKIAEEHGGAVSVESEVGRGSTFRLQLPVTAVAPGPDGTLAPIDAGDRPITP
ncbi:MAG: ATP-binding protein [Planctomycetota bacterium]